MSDRITVQCIAEGQRLSVPVKQDIYTGQRNYIDLHFTFNTIWDDITPRYAVFGKSGVNSLTQQIGTNGIVTVPWEMMTCAGRMYVSVYGGDRMTTNLLPIDVYQSGYDPNAGTPQVPTQDLVQQITAIAQSVRDDADAGAFDGIAGPQGIKGDPGSQGVKGDPGNHAIVSVPYSAAITAAANTQTVIGELTGACAITLGEELSGYENEWDVVITQGTSAYAVTLPGISWGLGVAPTFLAGTATMIRLYYIGTVLCGEWMAVEV